ncbi:atp-binding cassette superfamily [Phytophthora cinnamomi]|uniref:atp-binding cassette superfamily n=1 Tax=Phytophthora cinnamomi TaxID=4785 RepID=UPI0035596FEA|nr:atp-binding cassette superfamily [Phytophthora cinnamomi]
MWWIQPLLKRGYASPLDETCVWDLPTSDQARPLQEKFDKFYNGQHELDRAKRPNVNNAIWESVKPTWGIAFVLHLAGAGLMLFQPFVIKAILKSIKGEDNSLGISSGYTLAVLLGCAAFCGATAVSAGQFLTTRVACNARMIVINSAFRKILRLSATARRTMDTGEIVTFVGVDSDRVSAAYKLGMWCIVAPLMLVAVCILIGTQMGTIVAVVASISMVLLVLGSLAMSKKIGDHRRQISRISANRLKVTNEMLQGIRVVRFYGWEGFVNELIHEIREKEIALLRKYNHLRLANTVLMFLAPTLLNLACFAATILLGGSLDVATTFVILALTNACRTPFSIFADASVAVAEAVTSTSRLSDFLAAGESARSIKGEDIRGGTPIISLKDADFQWEEDASTPTLCNINLTLQPGTLTIVVGAVGSGKSSLVNAIIEEMQLVRGTRVVRGDVALQMYIDYLAASEWNGWILGVAIVILFSVTQATLFVSDWFLSRWSQGSVALSQNNSLAVYVGIVAGAALLVLGRCFFFMEICMTCSVKIHLKHLRKVIAAPITTFFDVTPIGRILNRFSRDLDEVDNPLPYWALWLLLCIFQVLSSFIVCAAVNPFVLIVYGPVGYGCWFAAKVYQSSARELKRLDGVTRSPFLNLMSETISGIETVRAYKMVDAFANRCEELLNNNSKVYFLSQTAARWFDMRADWFVSLIIGVVAVLAIATKSSNALRRLDAAGDGYLDANVFMKKLIQRLKCPLTRPEREFLLEQLRAQGTAKGENVLDYEQLGRICNLSSDDSLSESDTEHEQAKPLSPSKSSQLGSGFLAAEKRLTEFLHTPLTNSTPAEDTPRSLFTGAERFLEIAEGIDLDNTGLLPEDGEIVNLVEVARSTGLLTFSIVRTAFTCILGKCGVNIDPELLNGMLSRFPRSSGNQINYPAFLQRYGQNPQCSRGRRELKQLVLNLLSKLTVPKADWLRFLLHRFEKFDKKLHGSMKGALPTEAFLRAVQGRSVVFKLTVDETAQVTSLFLRSSTNSSPKHLRYHEFLVFVTECHQMPPEIDTRLQVQLPPPTSPKSTEVPLPEAASPDSSSELDTSAMSVGDYLMSHATMQERRNFENLMEVLQDFKKKSTRAHQDVTIQPIENGVMMPLGKHLRVKVQFSLAEAAT